jgi:hypothetical protein
VKPFTTIAVALLALIAIAHLLRLFAGWEVTVSGFTVPVWFSLPGFIIAGWLGRNGVARVAWASVNIVPRRSCFNLCQLHPRPNHAFNHLSLHWVG